jgi:hypothetical protein
MAREVEQVTLYQAAVDVDGHAGESRRLIHDSARLDGGSGAAPCGLSHPQTHPAVASII